jgi:Putative Actinobacterial Holin-X, holin superfamily III
MSKSYEQPQGFDSRPLRAVPSAREEDNSIGGLLKQLAREIPLLFTKELALAKSEMRENLRATKAGVAAVATGGAVMLAGLVVLLMAGVYGLGTVLPAWLSALIVGAAAVVVGWIMVAAGKKQFDPASLKPDHTIHSLRKDADAIGGRTP